MEGGDNLHELRWPATPAGGIFFLAAGQVVPCGQADRHGVPVVGDTAPERQVVKDGRGCAVKAVFRPARQSQG